MQANVKKCVAGLLLLIGGQCARGEDREDFLDAPDRVQWEAGGLYDGRFDDGTPFQIELAYPLPEGLPARLRQRFAQAVWYPRDYTGTPSRLLPAGGAGMAMRLAVANADGVAGDETYTVTLSPDRASGRGVLTRPGAAGQRGFTLQRSVPYAGIAVARPASAELASFSTYYRERGFAFSAFFPLLGDAEADGWIRQQAGYCRDEGECANTVRVSWRSPSLVSLTATAWGDSGGAHGDGYSTTRQYRIQDGAMTPLGLDAFLDLGASCRALVSAATLAGLRAQGMSWPEKAGLDARGAAKFTPTPDGIAFHYDAYEAGSYAQGAPTVFVPRAAMAGCVKYLPAAD
jgi:hypothetical protein